MNDLGDHAPPSGSKRQPNQEVNWEAISVVDLMLMIWRRRWILVGTVAAALLLAVGYLHFATYKYTATLTLSPVAGERSGLGGTLGKLGDLAAIGGISLPTDQGALPFILYVEGLRAFSTAEALAKDQGLMTRLFRDEWDPEAGTFKEPTSAVYTAVRGLKGVLGVPSRPWAPPDAERVHRILQETLSVSEDSKKPIVRIAWESDDPKLAAEFVQKLHEAVDSAIRVRARIRAEENIGYLQAQLEKVTLAEHRAALAQSLTEQEKVRMAANASLPYAAEPYGRAIASSRPTSPRPVLVLALAVMGGGLLGTLLALLLPGRQGSA